MVEEALPDTNDREKEAHQGKKVPIGCAVFIIIIAIIFLLLPPLGAPREKKKQVVCMMNMKTIYLALDIYAEV